MSDIFREVDEDLRSESYQKLWDKYGRLLIGAAVGVVVVTALWQGWTNWQRTQNEADGERYMAAAQIAARGQTGAAIAMGGVAVVALAERGLRAGAAKA